MYVVYVHSFNISISEPPICENTVCIYGTSLSFVLSPVKFVCAFTVCRMCVHTHAHKKCMSNFIIVYV